MQKLAHERQRAQMQKKSNKRAQKSRSTKLQTTRKDPAVLKTLRSVKQAKVGKDSEDSISLRNDNKISRQ